MSLIKFTRRHTLGLETHNMIRRLKAPGYGNLTKRVPLRGTWRADATKIVVIVGASMLLIVVRTQPRRNGDILSDSVSTQPYNLRG